MAIRRRLFALLVASLLAIGAPTLPASAQDDGTSVDEVLDGFEDEADAEDATDGPADEASAESAPSETAEDSEPEAPTRSWELTGGLDWALAFALLDHSVPNPDTPPADRTEWNDLVKNRIHGDLQLDANLGEGWDLRVEMNGFYDFAYISKGKDEFSEAVIDVYEWEVDSGEVYIEGTIFPFLDVKVGRQIENWGRSETIRIVDLINPLDLREIGLVDIEELRRPVAMVKFDAYWRAWTVTAAIIPEQRFDRNPPPGSDYFPTVRIELPKGLVVPPGLVPNNLPNFDARRASDLYSPPEYALRIGGVFSGWDISFYGGVFTENRLVLDYKTFRLGSFRLPDPNTVEFDTNRIAMVGTGANYLIGSWLFKVEGAWLDGLRSPETGEKSRVDMLVGVEYYGLRDTTIAFEVADRRWTEYDRLMKRPQNGRQRQDNFETALRITTEWLNSRLKTTFLALILGDMAQSGSLFRLSGTYELADGWNVEGGFVIYERGGDRDAIFNDFDSNDRFFAALHYDF